MFTCREVQSTDGAIAYEVVDSMGEAVVCMLDFYAVEAMLIQLNTDEHRWGIRGDASVRT